MRTQVFILICDECGNQARSTRSRADCTAKATADGWVTKINGDNVCGECMDRARVRVGEIQRGG